MMGLKVLKVFQSCLEVVRVAVCRDVFAECRGTLKRDCTLPKCI